MSQRVLITGGAGFIGAHLAAELLQSGYQVRALDNLDRQVHPRGMRPDYLSPDVELIEGDVRDPGAVARAVSGVSIVCHLAAAVGVGQSMYEVERYTDINERGTAVLIDRLAKSEVQQLLVASSMSVYGEGLMRSAAGLLIAPGPRTLAQLKAGRWDIEDGLGGVLHPVETPEDKAPQLTSIYALNKYSQERMALIFGASYGRKAVAMRFFNTYGPNQALSNPYTGVLAIFASRLLNGRAPIIFEDGQQRRDFVHVRDVARACRLALETPEADGMAFNVGSGSSRSIAEVAVSLAATMHKNRVVPQISGKYRSGDIRHCFADTSLARKTLGFEPTTSFEDGLVELAEWLSGRMCVDSFEQAAQELVRRGLVA